MEVLHTDSWRADGSCSRIACVCVGMTRWLVDALCVDVDQCNQYAKTKKKKKHLPRCACVCACVQICCMQTQISVNKKTKQKNLLVGRGGGQSVQTCCVCVDADRGRECLGSWTHCVCMQMDCVWTRMSVKKKQKSTYLAMVTGHMSIQLHCVQTCWRADTDDCEEK